jgi:hypothetical protein
MSTSSQSPTLAHANPREQFANQQRVAGWIGFWFELVLGIVSFMILLIALIDPAFNVNLKSGLGLAAISAGLLVLGISIYWMLSYVRIARKLLSPEPSDHLSAESVRQTLHQGMNIHFLGLLLSLVAAQIIISNLLLKVLTIPGGSTIYQSQELLDPLDMFVVQSSLFMIASESVGLFITVWLLRHAHVRKG